LEWWNNVNFQQSNNPTIQQSNNPTIQQSNNPAIQQSMKKIFLAYFFLMLITPLSQAQKNYRVACIGFYNFENLFDTEDDPKIRDEEFTPEGDKVWTEGLYAEKMGNLARVVSEIGTDVTPDGLAILGVSEVENRRVLEDFVKHPKVADRNYQIVHQDSPDRRGIDVALIYNPKYFKLLGNRNIPLLLYREDGSRIYTRDVLHVTGMLDGEIIHVLVNHWPSRSGGEKVSQPRRNAGADLNKAVVDSLTAADPNAKILIMGDLNDDPVSPSVKKHLAAKGKKSAVRPGGLYNPMLDYYRKGLGTLAYRDAWSLFDMVILSYGTINPDAGGYQYYKSGIFNPKYLFQKSGQFKGYPFRTFGGDTYLGGFSDHFPVYVYLVKEL
jgi:hypothetical protein